MEQIYSDKPIKQRAASGAGADSNRKSIKPSSGWNFITADELYAGYSASAKRVVPKNVPPKIAKLLEMMDPYQDTDEGRAEAFIEQARFMADYEDDYVMRDKPVRHIFTAYQEMSVDELRGYFSWRAKVRRHEIAETNRDFVRLYAAELINLTGSSTPPEAFDRLLRFAAWLERCEGGTQSRLLSKMLGDFVIAWDLEHELAEYYCVREIEKESMKLALSQSRTADDYSLYKAIHEIAQKQIDSSPFFSICADDAVHVIARTCRCVNDKRKDRKGAGILDRLLGRQRETAYGLFNWLPFIPQREDGYLYRVDEVTSYRYKNGGWTCISFADSPDPDAVRQLSELIRECERLMRKAFHYKNNLPDRMKDQETASMISNIIDAWTREKEEHSRPVIHIDLSKLSSIRTAADVTRDRLLEGTEEESAAGEAAWREPGADDRLPAAGNMINKPEYKSSNSDITQSSMAEASAPENEGHAIPDVNAAERADQVRTADGDGSPGEGSVFSKAEAEFLRLLLDGGGWKEYLSARHLTASVFIDRINEKAYDEMGDSVIMFDGKRAEIVEDYREDVLGLLT